MSFLKKRVRVCGLSSLAKTLTEDVVSKSLKTLTRSESSLKPQQERMSPII
jgi:hypothetical protein